MGRSIKGGAEAQREDTELTAAQLTHAAEVVQRAHTKGGTLNKDEVDVVTLLHGQSVPPPPQGSPERETFLVAFSNPSISHQQLFSYSYLVY